MKKFDSVVTFRLPKKDHEEWKLRALDLNQGLGDFIRSSVAAADPVGMIQSAVSKTKTPTKAAQPRKHKDCDPALLQAVAQCGNNINQIARNLNRGKDDMDILKELKLIRDRLYSYVN